MASHLTHAWVAGVLSALYPRDFKPARFWAVSVACALLPDLDLIGMALGIPYDHVLGHRGLTHSLPFAVLAGVGAVKFTFPRIRAGSGEWWGLAAYFAVITASHGILDALTNGGYGIAFFAPFDATRYFFGWTPLEVSPIGLLPFFSARGVAVLRSELVWIWLPSLLLLAVVRTIQWSRRPTKEYRHRS